MLVLLKRVSLRMYSSLVVILILHSFTGTLVMSEKNLSSYAAAAIIIPNSDILMDCLNRNQPRHWKTSIKHALRDKMTAVPVAGAWSTRHPPKVPATLVTQLSLDRLEQLEAQCRSWSGPISSVVYMALRLRDDWVKDAPPTTSDSLQVALEELKEFHARMERGHVCQVKAESTYRR